MTALGEVGTAYEIAPALGVKMLMFTYPDTVIGGTDTVQIDLNDYGCTELRGIHVFDETTDGSVVVLQAPTTVVTSGVLVVTLGGSDTGKKTIVVYAQ